MICTTVKNVYIFSLLILFCFICFFSVKAFYAPPEDDRIKITVGVDSGFPEDYRKNQIREVEFEKKYPDIDVQIIPYSYYMDFFDANAINKNIPMYFPVWYSDIERMVNNGYVMDLTDYLESNGCLEKINPEIKSAVTYDGRVFAIPENVYVMGMILNKDVFAEAGLVDEKGNALIPKTFDDVWEYAKIIKKRTGKYGYAFNWSGNNPGWQLTNVAWNYGVEFIKEEEGKKKACFDSEKMIELLQELYTLRWEYDAIYCDPGVNASGLTVIKDTFGMYITTPTAKWGVYSIVSNGSTVNYTMPEGDGGKYALLGGNAYVIASNISEEELAACLKWAEFSKATRSLDDEIKLEWENELIAAAGSGNKSILRVPDIWNDSERNQYIQELVDKYGDENAENVRHYNNYDDITLKPEIPINCQKLYSILSECIRKIMTNPNVDIPKLIHDANAEYENEYLN